MKANRKFRGHDEAVSPVIAVILMVAITVVLAATVYVWVSGFSAGGTAAKTISLTKLQNGNVITYTVASASTELKWSDMRFEVTGPTTAYQILTSVGDSTAVVAGATLTPTSTASVKAGDMIYVVNAVNSAVNGVGIKVVDTAANGLMSTLGGGNLAATGAAPPASTALTCTRMSGTSGTWAAGNVIRVTFPDEFDAATVAQTTITADWAVTGGTAPTLGASATALAKSPTVVEITLGTAPALNVGGTTALSLASAGAIKWIDGTTNFASVTCNIPA